MKALISVMSWFDWLALPRSILGDLTHPDPRGAWPFFVQLDSGWSMPAINRLLAARGIATWGSGVANGELYFRVRRGQAAWAQYLLLKAGVPLQHRLLADPLPKSAQPRRDQGPLARWLW